MGTSESTDEILYSTVNFLDTAGDCKYDKKNDFIAYCLAKVLRCEKKSMVILIRKSYSKSLKNFLKPYIYVKVLENTDLSTSKVRLTAVSEERLKLAAENMLKEKYNSYFDWSCYDGCTLCFYG